LTNQASLAQLTAEISHIYESDPSMAGTGIEGLLEKRLGDLSSVEKLSLLKRLKAEFQSSDARPGGNGYDDISLNVFSLLLGREVSRADLSSEELLKRLAESLNTIFDALNELVSVINATLSGQGVEEQTIRQVIGFHLGGEDQTGTLESYLGQIRKAFLVSQEAFKRAAQTKVDQILTELNPESIEAAKGGGLKFGPLRKAELYSIYEEKFRTIRKWFESGRFQEELQREFERHSRDFFVDSSQ